MWDPPYAKWFKSEVQAGCRLGQLVAGRGQGWVGFLRVKAQHRKVPSAMCETRLAATLIGQRAVTLGMGLVLKRH